MSAADSRHRPRGAVDLPQGWVKKFPDLHPAVSAESTRYPSELMELWSDSDRESALLSESIRRRQDQIGKDEIRHDPILVELRKKCIALHYRRIRINIDLIKFRKNYDSAKDPRAVTDVEPKEPQ